MIYKYEGPQVAYGTMLAESVQRFSSPELNEFST